MFYTLSTNRVTPYIANFRRRTRSSFLSQITILNHSSPFESYHGGYIQSETWLVRVKEAVSGSALTQGLLKNLKDAAAYSCTRLISLRSQN